MSTVKRAIAQVTDHSFLPSLFEILFCLFMFCFSIWFDLCLRLFLFCFSIWFDLFFCLILFGFSIWFDLFFCLIWFVLLSLHVLFFYLIWFVVLPLIFLFLYLTWFVFFVSCFPLVLVSFFSHQIPVLKKVWEVTNKTNGSECVNFPWWKGNDSERDDFLTTFFYRSKAYNFKFTS